MRDINANHRAVNHSQYEFGRSKVSTNTVESFFSTFKRGLVGTYQHVSAAHLQRYMAEFDFRHSSRARLEIDDAERTQIALKDIVGMRLTYRRIDEAPHA
ncbi:MAG: transposase [Alphaproteobacteria bacterium]|nr:transposase [Alphaproteobacteria bacterium]MDE2109899.1 transposase [Alphaproteobacteria bacterium]MDE2493789.1 transposase [Alphaproteobacteria bacterium]